MIDRAPARPRLLYLVTEDWYFLSHRLPMARAARDAGFEVHVATRVGEHGAAIKEEGFALHPLDWRRGATGALSMGRAVAEIAALYRRVRPDLAHHVAMKPVLLGGIAARLARVPVAVSAITGLGSTLIGEGGLNALVRAGLPRILNASGQAIVVQNVDDRLALSALGGEPARIHLIPGSGIDLAEHPVQPEPDGPFTVAIAARMLADKGVRPLIEAVRALRAARLDVRLLLAGGLDPENPTAISRAEIEAWAREPGIEWLGQVADIRTVWARAHVAALPSRREGLPKALLEAAAAGRAMVATDAPGCRDVVLDEETGLLVPVDDAAAIAQALRRLMLDPDLRRRLGENARRHVADHFAAERVAREIVALYRSLLE